jgi:hypothetical protein
LTAGDQLAALYTGTVHFSSSDVLAGLPADYTFTAGDAGVHTFTVTLKTAGVQSVTAIDTSSSSINGTTAVTVSAASATHFSVTGAGSSIAGNGFMITVMALDAYGNTATGYLGSIHFTSSDGQGSLPVDYTFTAADQGSHSFSIDLKTAGIQTVTATDTPTGAIRGSVGVNVSPGAATVFNFNVPATATAGQPYNVTLTALDAYGNVATGYTGTVHFSSTDTIAGPPANYTFTGAGPGNSNGTFLFAVTPKLAGLITLVATDTINAAITGQGTVNVSPGAAIAFNFIVPATATAGQPYNVTLTALDAYGNVATGYIGTVHFSSSDHQAILAADYTFTGGDAGVHTFSNGFILKTAGRQTVTATDSAAPSLTSTAPVSVSAAAASQLIVAAPAGSKAGAPFTITVTALDAYGNVATGYTGTVHFRSSDALATLPADYTFTASDAGVHTFTNRVTLKTTGSQTVTATDKTTPWIGNGGTLHGGQTLTASHKTHALITGTATVLVTAAAASPIDLQAWATGITVSGLTVAMIGVEPFDNLAASYVGTVQFFSSDSRATFPADFTSVVADKVQSASAAGLRSRMTSSQILRLNDTHNPSIAANHTVTVKDVLAAAVNAGPGCEGFTAGDLDRFFAANQNRS